MPRRLKSRGAREPSAETKTAGKVANTSTAASEATILELGPSSFRSQRQRCAPFPTAFPDGPTRPTFRHGPPRKNRPLPSYLAHPVPWPTLSEREGLIAFLARPWFDDGGNYRVVFSRRLCDFIFFSCFTFSVGKESHLQAYVYTRACECVHIKRLTQYITSQTTQNHILLPLLRNSPSHS